MVNNSNLVVTTGRHMHLLSANLRRDLLWTWIDTLMNWCHLSIIFTKYGSILPKNKYINDYIYWLLSDHWVIISGLASTWFPWWYHSNIRVLRRWARTHFCNLSNSDQVAYWNERECWRYHFPQRQPPPP